MGSDRADVIESNSVGPVMGEDLLRKGLPLHLKQRRAKPGQF